MLAKTEHYFRTKATWKIIFLMTGFDLARQLHAMGFTKLIIYAGEEPKSPPPEYLKVVIKGLIDADKILGEI